LEVHEIQTCLQHLDGKGVERETVWSVPLDHCSQIPDREILFVFGSNEYDRLHRLSPGRDDVYTLREACESLVGVSRRGAG